MDFVLSGFMRCVMGSAGFLCCQVFVVFLSMTSSAAGESETSRVMEVETVFSEVLTAVF